MEGYKDEDVEEYKETEKEEGDATADERKKGYVPTVNMKLKNI